MPSNKYIYDALASEFEQKIDSRLPADKKLIDRFTACLLKRFFEPTVLDIGPGNGNMLKLLHDAGCEVSAIEISPKMAKVAKQNCPAAEITVGDFLTTSFDQRFSGVLACAFIHLFKENELKDVLDTLENLLAEQGILLVATTKHDRSYSEVTNKTNFSKPLKRFRRRFTKEELEKILLKRFDIEDYWENTDSEEDGKNWMNFICVKK